MNKVKNSMHKHSTYQNFERTIISHISNIKIYDPNHENISHITYGYLQNIIHFQNKDFKILME